MHIGYGFVHIFYILWSMSLRSGQATLSCIRWPWHRVWNVLTAHLFEAGLLRYALSWSCVIALLLVDYANCKDGVIHKIIKWWNCGFLFSNLPQLFGDLVRCSPRGACNRLYGLSLRGLSIWFHSLCFSLLFPIPRSYHNRDDHSRYFKWFPFLKFRTVDSMIPTFRFLSTDWPSKRDSEAERLERLWHGTWIQTEVKIGGWGWPVPSGTC